MIRLEANPSFIASCWFQLEYSGDGWLFTFCKIRFEYNSEDEVIWQSKTPYTKEIGEIEQLSKAIINSAKEDGAFMIDGIRLNSVTVDGGQTRSHGFIMPQAGSDELQLIHLFMSLAQRVIDDQSFINYIELLEQYFPFGLPVKIFDEVPKRLRIYGSLSTDEKAAFTDVISTISEDNAVVVDMTNFTGMGTFLYECFKPLNKTSQLSFFTNNQAELHLKAIGFDSVPMKLVK